MKKIFAITGIVLLMSSCASLMSIFNKDGTEGGEIDGSGGSSFSNQPVYTMKEQSDKGHWVSMPSSNGLTIIGISSPMSKAADELTAAKEDAARKIAMYYGLEGIVETTTGFDGRRYFGSVSEYTVTLVYDQDHLKYVEGLTFDEKKDVIKVDGVVLVRFNYPISAESFNYNASAKSNERPQWTQDPNPPQISGYMTSIGIAQNQARVKDTFNKSIEAAIASMVQEISTEVVNTDTAYMSNSGLSGGASSTVSTKSRGKLNSFHIIEYWVDPKTKSVYTLAIAKRSE